MMRSITGFLLLASAAAVGAYPAPLALRRYANIKYGFSVSLPAGSSVCLSTPPQPNHGVLFRPAGVTSPPCDDDIEDGARYTIVDGRYATDDEPADIVDFARKECSEMTFGSEGRVSIIAPPAHPGKLLWAACRINGKEGSISEILLSYRRNTAPNPAIIYTARLKTTIRESGKDHAAFVRWLYTMKFTGLPH